MESCQTKSGWHQRVYAQRGRASSHSCIDCGGQAKDWSQIHGTTGHSIADYQPRCRACHAAYDKPIKTPKMQTSMRGNQNAKGATRSEEARNKVRLARQKLTEAEILEIRGKHGAGEKQYLLAAEYGVGIATISRIVNGITYR